jgi:hypothetical protein
MYPTTKKKKAEIGLFSLIKGSNMEYGSSLISFPNQKMTRRRAADSINNTAR